MLKSFDLGSFPKRKFRWLLQVETENKIVLDSTFVKIHDRPSIQIFGDYRRAEWDDFRTTIPDCSPEILKEFYEYLANVYNFHDKKEGSTLATLNVSMVDNEGNPLEYWTMMKCFPKSINFGELSHSSSECIDMEITWRIGEVKYIPVEKKIEPVVPAIDEIEIDFS